MSAHRYTAKDSARAIRVLSALLPEPVKATATVAADGWQFQITICGVETCKTYDFQAGLEDRHLLQLSEWWQSGREIASEIPSITTHTARTLITADEAAAWVRQAHKGDRAVYFRGELAQFRYSAPKRVVELQPRIDGARNEYQRKPAEIAELRNLEERLALIRAMDAMHVAGLVEYLQDRMQDGGGAVYYAVRR